MGENSSVLGIKERKCTIITDQNLAPRILDIIKNSKEFCFLVTPYIDLFDEWEHFDKILKNANSDKKRIIFILKQVKRKDEIKAKDEKFKKKIEEEIERDEKKKENAIKALNETYKFDLFFVDKLHAKMYINESEVLITSMNLTNHAKEYNYEIGCLIEDPDTSKEIAKEIIFENILREEKKEYKAGISADWLKERIKGSGTT